MAARIKMSPSGDEFTVEGQWTTVRRYLQNASGEGQTRFVDLEIADGPGRVSINADLVESCLEIKED